MESDFVVDNQKQQQRQKRQDHDRNSKLLNQDKIRGKCYIQ